MLEPKVGIPPVALLAVARRTPPSPPPLFRVLAKLQSVVRFPNRNNFEPKVGIEPTTSFLPRKRSTTELLWRNINILSIKNSFDKNIRSAV